MTDAESATFLAVTALVLGVGAMLVARVLRAAISVARVAARARRPGVDPALRRGRGDRSRHTDDAAHDLGGPLELWEESQRVEVHSPRH